MATMTVQYATPKLMLSHAPRRVTYCVCDTCTPLVAIVLDRFNWFKRHYNLCHARIIIAIQDLKPQNLLKYKKN